MIRKGIELMKEQNADGVVLLGEPVYYSRFGFKNHPELIFPGVPAEYFMALPLKETIPAGDVTYHPDFC